MVALSDLSVATVLAPVVLALAIFGYVVCLSRFLWQSLLATVAVGGVIYLIAPITADTAVIWSAATLAVLGAVWLSRRRVPGAVPAKTARNVPPLSTPRRAEASAASKGGVVIDGTNVLYWGSERANLATLKAVVQTLVARDYAPMVFLDASSRHHLRDKSLTEANFATALGLPQTRVTVCPAGSEADAFLLKYAAEQGVPVVSNDRFGDRAKQAKSLRIVKGVITDGKPIFEGF